MELNCICQRTRLFSLFINPDETALHIQSFHYMSNVKHGSWGEVNICYSPGGSYWEKLCPRSWLPPEAVGTSA